MIRTGVIFLVGLLLTGCNAYQLATKKGSGVEMNNVKPGESVGSDKLSDIEKMEQCQRELEALKRIDAGVYTPRKADFDRVMQEADIYSGVRSDVRTYTQEAVDAYYRYRVDKLCADISKDVLDGLSDKTR